jgi:hypothetical protein
VGELNWEDKDMAPRKDFSGGMTLTSAGPCFRR